VKENIVDISLSLLHTQQIAGKIKRHSFRQGRDQAAERTHQRSSARFSSQHHAMLQGKTTGSSSDNIITILQWEKQHTPHLLEEQKVMLGEQKNKTEKLFQFTATSTNPWDEVQFTFWKHKVTNMALSVIRLPF
jgi:hypothetical protein